MQRKTNRVTDALKAVAAHGDVRAVFSKARWVTAFCLLSSGLTANIALNHNNNYNNNNNERISRAPFPVKHAQLRWTGVSTKIQNTCVIIRHPKQQVSNHAHLSTDHFTLGLGHRRSLGGGGRKRLQYVCYMDMMHYRLLINRHDWQTFVFAF